MAQDQIMSSISRQGNDIRFTCEYFLQQGVRVQVVSVSADGSNRAAVPVDGSTSLFSAQAAFSVTPSDEKAAYCEVGDISTDLVYFGGEYKMNIVSTLLYSLVKRCIPVNCMS